MSNYKCDNSDVIQLMRKAIETIKPLASDPQKRREL